MTELDEFDLSEIDPIVIEEAGSELEAFQKLSLDAVYNRFGVVAIAFLSFFLSLFYSGNMHVFS